jgi:aconitate hydratase
MGVLPLQFLGGETCESLGLSGEETFVISGISSAFSSGANVCIAAAQSGGKPIKFEAKLRIDTPQEAEYYRNGGILPYVLRQLIATNAATV